MDKVIDSLFELQPLTLYVLLAVFCWTEAAFFLGFVTPGELAVVTGGILAARGQVEFDTLIIVVTCATVAGNATGFFLGRRYGEKVLDWRPLQRFLGGAIQKAKDFMLRRGEWAIVVGRVSTPTRVMTPFLAGASGLSYRRFVALDVFASLMWAACFLTLGYVLGESWDVIKEISGRAATLVLILFVSALVIRWAAARVAAHQQRVKAAFRLALRATGTRGIATTLAPGFRWLSRRLDPRIAQGLSLTVCFFALLGAVAAVGLVFSQIHMVWGLARIDFPVLDWMSETRTEAAVEIARNGLLAFHWPGVLALIVPIVALVAWLAGTAPAFRFMAGVVGATSGAFLLDRFALEGHVPNAEFPAVSVAAAAALAIHAIALTARLRDWSGAVACGGFGVFAVFTVALGTLVAGWSGPSGIALGLAIGTGWSALLELPWAVYQRDGMSSRPESDTTGPESAPAQLRETR